MTSQTTLPLFPLHTILFPGGQLKLRIFEVRYVDMIGRCMREGAGFGVATIVDGVEAGGPARTADVGTLARIVDFEQLSGGLLGITAIGAERFKIDEVHRQSDGLNVANVQWLPVEAATPIEAQYTALGELARLAFPQLKALYGDMQPDYENASWVGMRLAEILPLAPEDRQHCLEIVDGPARLQFLSERITVDGAGSG